MSLPDTAYGSDSYGFIAGFEISPLDGGQPLDLNAALEWLDSTDKPSGSFLWLHFNLNDAEAKQLLEHRLQVSHDFMQAISEGSRSTRIERSEDHLVAVINDVAYEFAFDPSEIASMVVHVEPRLLITARTHALLSADRLRLRVRKGERFSTPLEMLVRLLEDQQRVLEHIVRESTLKIDQIEDGLLAGRLAARRKDLGTMRRVLVRLQRLLAPDPGALHRLMRDPPKWVATPDMSLLREVTEEFSLVIQDISTLQERIRLLQEEIQAVLSERSSRSLFTLTVLTVLALPINMVAGLMGMNVGGVPFGQDPDGFWWVLGFVMMLTTLAAYLVSRSRP